MYPVLWLLCHNGPWPVRISGALCGVPWSKRPRAGVKVKSSYLQAQYHRLKTRCGSNRALIAVAHSLLQSIYYLLLRKEPYKDLGGDYFDKLRPANTTKRLVSRLETLGYKVTLETTAAA